MAEHDHGRPLDETADFNSPAGSQIGHYRLTRLLGRGGSGFVFQAFDETLKRDVAVKVLAPEYAADIEMRDRFLREAQKQAAMNHPNVATIHEIGDSAGKQFIAMEYIEGESLKDLLQRGQLSLDQGLRIFLQVCDGLQAAHDHQIVHRDIKPGNIMITKDGHAKILDFGLAKLQRSSAESSSGHIVGTAHYMSPEQAQGRPLDVRSDVFSMGTLLYELVTHRLPFSGEHTMAVLFAIVHLPYNDIPSLNPEVPPGLCRVIDRALQKAPEARYQSIRAMADDLRSGAKAEARAPLPITAERVSVAVIPFDNRGRDDLSYFADGVAEEINGYLSRLARLKVISFSSSRKYRMGEQSPRAIGAELGCGYLLLGSLGWDTARTQPFVRIHVELVNPADGTVRWSESYDREVNEIFAVQSEVGEQVARALGVLLGEPELSMLADRHTASVEAYDCFLRANEIFPHSLAEEDLHRAIDLYRRAVEIDPRFAHAHARLARAHISMYWFHYDHTAERLAQAKQCVDRALSIAPESPEAKQALGYYYYYGMTDYVKALEQFSSVSSRRPNDASILASKGYIMRRLGKWNEALRSIESASDLDPKSALITYERANTLLLLRRYDEAIPILDHCLWLAPAWSDLYVKKAMACVLRDWNLDQAAAVIRDASKHLNPTELGVEWILLDALVRYFNHDYDVMVKDLWVDEGEMEIYFIVKARISARLGHHAESVSAYDSARVLLETRVKSQADDARLHMHLAIALAGIGKRDLAHASGLRALELVPSGKDHVLGTFLMELMSLVYVMTDDFDSAVGLLRQILISPANFSVAFVRNFSGFDKIRNYPPFQALIS